MRKLSAARSIKMLILDFLFKESLAFVYICKYKCIFLSIKDFETFFCNKIQKTYLQVFLRKFDRSFPKFVPILYTKNAFTHFTWAEDFTN